MNFAKVDGRHKLAVVGAIVCWGLSMYFSKEGFGVGQTTMLWVGWILAGIVTIVELVFNSQTTKLSLTLIVTGFLCYVYGIWTNVTGFWTIQHPGTEFIMFAKPSMMAWFVGFIMEVLPEPLFMWGVAAAFDGDFLGNLAGLWSGNLPYARQGLQQKIDAGKQPMGFSNKGNVPNQKSQYKAQHKPQRPANVPMPKPNFVPSQTFGEPTYRPNNYEKPEPPYLQASRNGEE